MPARNYRVTLYNATRLTLTLKEPHLCFGAWTPGGWEPPATIFGGDTKAWQSESNAPLQGTEGWVKYALDDPLNPNSGEQVYVHWQVPYLGAPVVPGLSPPNVVVAHLDPSSSQVSIGDVTPHCDAGSSGGSGFSGSATHELLFAGASPDDGTQPTIGEVLAAYSNPVSTIAAFIFGIDAHLYVWLHLRQKGSVSQSLPLGYDPSRGLRALAAIAQTSSVRKLLAL